MLPTVAENGPAPEPINAFAYVVGGNGSVLQIIPFAVTEVPIGPLTLPPSVAELEVMTEAASAVTVAKVGATAKACEARFQCTMKVSPNHATRGWFATVHESSKGVAATSAAITSSANVRASAMDSVYHRSSSYANYSRLAFGVVIIVTTSS